ncbi:MAG: VWA domain-containing protein [Candidatus Gracilibacteria bacterium]|nr:VWA domain-containing protein [Candidatus Gracilibacteria bacterium]
MLKLLYINYFLLLIPIILFLLLLYFKGGNKKFFSAIGDLKNVFKSNSNYYRFYYLLIFVIFVLFTVVFSKPVIGNTYQNVIKNGIDIQIVLDVSYSMTATDLDPNRLEVAKDVIYDFVDSIVSDRLGLIIYSGKVFTSLPLNFDYNIIKKTIKKIDINTINQQYMFLQGTATGDALILAGKSFSSDNREKVIILLTDGEANKGMHPYVAVKYLNEKYNGKIRIYTVGIGGDEKTTVSVTSPDGQIQELEIGGVNEEVLKNISTKTDGLYFRATDRNTLEQIFDKISKLEKKEIITETVTVNIEKYRLFINLVIIFFFIFLFLKYKKNI